MESRSDMERQQEADEEVIQQDEEEDKPQDVRELCVLCKTMPCCPEHCCDWDSCKCSDCEYCRANHSKGGEASEGCKDPSILIKSTGQEEVKKIKKPKKKGTQTEEDDIEKLPSEQTRAHDGALIINYEVPVEAEEEVVLAGGIKGIRALRQQRDAMNTQLHDILDQERPEGSNRFGKYEEEKR